MTCAFVFKDETVLCHQTADGIRPLPVSLSTPSSNQTSDAQHTPVYQLGCVPLFAAIEVHETNRLSSPSANETGANKEPNAATLFAISHAYALSHKLALPTIVDADHINDLTACHADTAAFIAYRQLITLMPSSVADTLSQGIQLLRWREDTQFCSRCGAAVNSAKSGERSMVCSVCRLRQYPRVQPCVITAITRPNPETGETQILLAHHHRYGQTSLPLQYGLIAGFVEVGESLEHAVVREVAEEVGITLSDIRYVSSQPWPFPSNLMLGFRASYQSGDIVLQEDELSHAEFFDLSALPKIPFKGSIAYDLIAQIAQEQGVVI
ncbi:NAD(+) diphosphatase [Psychrobacter sp. M13]|uniref:NAD(+) diphosphatase n=1 Tax=Psychrobacter sp. M13 TaxID=3067275 RepID=UPI00273CD174|nr:NAD(+) diphosphatase [Psychrobacter sp. M13]WLP93624.1 NAD(+) diphosphatase [Psychrobacter sp. M13]